MGIETAALIGAAGAMAGGAISANGAESAANTASNASNRAANLQYQSSQDILDFQRQIAQQDLAQQRLGNLLSERDYETNLGAYRDQYNLASKQWDAQQSQTQYGNNIRNAALSNLQQFTNLGLGSLAGLSQMTGGTTGSSPYTGPTPWGVSVPDSLGALQSSQVPYIPFNIDDIMAQGQGLYSGILPSEGGNDLRQETGNLSNNPRLNNPYERDSSTWSVDDILYMIDNPWSSSFGRNRPDKRPGWNRTEILGSVMNLYDEGKISYEEAERIIQMYNTSISGSTTGAAGDGQGFGGDLAGGTAQDGGFEGGTLV